MRRSNSLWGVAFALCAACSVRSTPVPETDVATEALAAALSCPTGVRSMSLNYADTCAVLAGGDVTCWGRDTSGQLGNGVVLSGPSPTPATVCGIAGALSVTTGPSHVCAATRDGALECWGEGFFGQLGDGDRRDSMHPRAVIGVTDAVMEASGVDFTCAVLASGGVACWGSDTMGTLGDGAPADLATTPRKVLGIEDAVAISAGQEHACALRARGTVACWGFNGAAQLGDGTHVSRSVAAAVPGVRGVRAIASGVVHTCALRVDGTIVCWGYNGYGALGDGTTTDAPVAVQVAGIHDARAIAAGGYETCAVRAHGSLACWGKNDVGQIGDGTTTDRYNATRVAELDRVDEVAVGDGHACARLVGGRMACWGANDFGQLGDGTTVERHVPGGVVGFGAPEAP